MRQTSFTKNMTRSVLAYWNIQCISEMQCQSYHCFPKTKPHFADFYFCLFGDHLFKSNELLVTETELAAIAKPAKAG